MQRILFIVLILILVVFYVQLYFGLGGYHDNHAVVLQIKTQKKINKELGTRNHDANVKLTGLKGSPEALEARARYELNLIKPGEILVSLPKNIESFAKTHFYPENTQ